MLKTKHFFPFIKMVKALDIKDALKEMYQKVKGKSQEELAQMDETEGIDYLFLFVEKLPNAEKEFYEFLSVYLDKSIPELKDMDLLELIETIKDIFQDPNFKAFFQRAVK